MADTTQVVNWSLAQSCKLRTGDAAHEAEAAFAAVGRAATYARYACGYDLRATPGRCPEYWAERAR